jgi:diacylglycerol kinase (ATP)
VHAEAKEVEKWTLSDVGEWLDHLQLGEYKYNFIRHDIQGSELLCLQRRDLKELGITKVGHIKRILQGIENLLGETRV